MCEGDKLAGLISRKEESWLDGVNSSVMKLRSDDKCAYADYLAGN